jgi:hypothetical protein
VRTGNSLILSFFKLISINLSIGRWIDKQIDTYLYPSMNQIDDTSISLYLAKIDRYIDR